MSYQEVMNVMLPSQGKTAAHITGHYGEVRAKGPHGGSDFNYEGGQAGTNLTHPTIHSPISGEVTFVGGKYGTIKIKDAEGNSHEILHTQSQSVKIGQHIDMGAEIGHMGGRGPNGATQYAQHVHYQMKDANGHPVNPEEFWKHRSPGTPSHAKSPTAEPHHASNTHPGTLRDGDKGAQVTALQESLNKLGYRDENGHALKLDGNFGAHTKAAVERFQKEHGLEKDGIVGKDTLKALQTQQKAGPRLDEKTHPVNGVYDKATDAVGRLDAQHGRTADESSQRLAGAATVAALKGGLTSIDHIVVNQDATKAYAVQGDLDSPLKKVAEIDMKQALATPLDKSSEAAMQQQQATQHSQGNQQAQQQQAADQHQQQQQQAQAQRTH